MSNDIAVFWSIDGINYVISNTNAENTYIKDLATMFVTQEGFSLALESF